MRASIISALPFVLSGCVAMTTSGTDEAVLFSRDAPAEQAQAVLKPYSDLPLSIEFACPSRMATLSSSYIVPLPPVLPIGFVNQHVSYLRVTMPEGADKAIAPRIVTPQGTAMPLSDARQARRVVNNEGTMEVTYALNKDCEALNDSTLEVAGFSYKNRNYPASVARLQFDSRFKGSLAWWPPVRLNGGRPLSGGDASIAPMQ